VPEATVAGEPGATHQVDAPPQSEVALHEINSGPPVETVSSFGTSDHGVAAFAPPSEAETPSIHTEPAPPVLEERSMEVAAAQPTSPFSAVETPEESAPEPAAAAGGDRIDDLLRQFRERYGRE
jgi:hypothetical protein